MDLESRLSPVQHQHLAARYRALAADTTTAWARGHLLGMAAASDALAKGGIEMDPTGILTTFGLFYAFTGAFYGVPMAVQPMKAASAAVLIEPMDPAAIAGAGLVIVAVFP